MTGGDTEVWALVLAQAEASAIAEIAKVIPGPDVRVFIIECSPGLRFARGQPETRDKGISRVRRSRLESVWRSSGDCRAMGYGLRR